MTLRDLSRIVREKAAGRQRFVVAIAGAPGSGKSTLAEKLSAELGEDAAVLPMDGFHLDNETLRARGLLARKGAPETFDCAGFEATLRQVRSGGALDVPTFDRAADRVVPGGATIPASVRIVLVEGNYLLLDADCWRDLAEVFDLTFMLEVPLPELERRLIARWLDNGLSAEDAIRRARENDLSNARAVVERSRAPDAVIEAGSGDEGTAGEFKVSWRE